MRVLTFLHSFELGGVERVALRLVRQWRELGIDAPLFLGRPDGVMREDVGDGLDFITPPPPPIPTTRWETLWMIWTLPRVVRRERPDVLFCAGNTYTVVAVALKLLLGSEAPPVLAKISNDLDRHDLPLWQRLFYRLWLRCQGRFLDHLVGMESPMADEIRDALAISPEAISIIPDPALSQGQIERLGQMARLLPAAGSGRRFVTVGRLVAQKNFAMMLRAFRRGAGERDVLTIIGDGPERARLTALAVELGLGDRVEFRGYVAEPAVHLARFDVFLLSSNYEGVPAVVLEALAARLPIIATDCCRSMRQLLGDGALGELVKVGDESAFASAIAAADPVVADAALSLAHVSRFTVERAADAYLHVMRRLAAQEPRDARRGRLRPGGSAQPSRQDPIGDIPA